MSEVQRECMSACALTELASISLRGSVSGTANGPFRRSRGLTKIDPMHIAITKARGKTMCFIFTADE